MFTLNPPRTQGLKSSTFLQPPCEPTLSVPALFDWQGEHAREHPIFLFEEAPGSKRTIKWGEAIQGFHRATRYVRDTVGYAGSGPKPLIAVLATSDTISFYSFIAGTLRTGWLLFPISPRNSHQAVAHLLSKSSATHLFISGEAFLQSLADASLNLLGSNAIQKCAMPTFELLFPTRGIDPTFVPEPFDEINMDDHGLILHSSGTTSFPKPIYFTQKAMIEICFFPCFGEVDLADTIFALHGVPLFHGSGILAMLYSLSCGYTMAVFKPQSPATIPNPTNYIEAAISDKFDYMFISPTFIESWTHEPRYVRALAAAKGIFYGGGPLGKETGDYLVSQGVNILCGYASTEVMGISTSFLKSQGKDWEYFSISANRKTSFIECSHNEFELVILESEGFRPNVINTKVDGCDGYATSDLLSAHPTKPGFWKIVGRTDDQIMHSTGEKTNPGPLEAMLKNDPFVQGSMIFGRGRFHAGVLVQPKAPFEFDRNDMKKVVDFRNLIWPTIERINAFAPTHSRIFKEMILITSPSKPLQFTPKGTLRRKVTLEQYTEEIDALYKAVDESAQANISGPVDWSINNATEFVREAIEKTMKGRYNLADSSDLFEFGLDSLQATYIRNTLLRALRQTHPSIAREVSSTFIYDHPSIASLAKYLSESVARKHASASKPEESRRQLYELVDKYTTSFPQFFPSDGSRTEGDVILITGGTGSLGSSILARLIENAEVALVYSLSRRSPDGTSVEGRQRMSFEREGLDLELLKSTKLRMLEGDPSRPHFGLSSISYQELQSSVTHIIHNAWRVNFDLAVASFEPNIRSVRNFVDFSLNGHGASPARLLFVSSIGVFQNYNGIQPAPEVHLSEPDSALGSGYAESKWISEQILRKASEKASISTTVLRCGQITGGPSGAWNEHEWFPSLIKSSIALGKLPATRGDVSWITGYDAAGAIVDSLHADAEPVLHILHPRPAIWNELMEAFFRKLNIPTVPYADWFSALEEAQRALQAISGDAAPVEKTLRENPALRLLEFFRAGKDHENDEAFEPPGLTKISCDKSGSVSETLRSAQGMNEENVRRWVSAWKKSGFL